MLSWQISPFLAAAVDFHSLHGDVHVLGLVDDRNHDAPLEGNNDLRDLIDDQGLALSYFAVEILDQQGGYAQADNAQYSDGDG